MLKKLLVVAFVVAGGISAAPVYADKKVESPKETVVDTDKTCKDLAGFDTNLESNTSGEWGSIEFSQDNGPLVLTVNDGYTVTLCTKKGSTSNGMGPIVQGPFVGPITDMEINYPNSNSEDGFSHYAFNFVKTPVTPEEPEVPEVPEVPETPETPEVPEVPAKPVGGRGEMPTAAPAPTPEVLPNTSGASTPVVVAGASALAVILLVAASAVKSRFVL